MRGTRTASCQFCCCYASRRCSKKTSSNSKSIGLSRQNKWVSVRFTRPKRRRLCFDTIKWCKREAVTTLSTRCPRFCTGSSHGARQNSFDTSNQRALKESRHKDMVSQHSTVQAVAVDQGTAWLSKEQALTTGQPQKYFAWLQPGHASVR